MISIMDARHMQQITDKFDLSSSPKRHHAPSTHLFSLHVSTVEHIYPIIGRAVTYCTPVVLDNSI